MCRRLGVSEQTFYRWKKQFAGLGLSELRELRSLRHENAKLKQVVARARCTLEDWAQTPGGEAHPRAHRHAAL